MRIQFLGTGSAINAESVGACIMLEQDVLVDAPGGINQTLLAAQADLNGLGAVLVTHAHGDHIFGLPFLLLEYMLSPRARPLLIVGPDSLEAKIVDLTRIAFPEAEPSRLLASANASYVTVHDGYEDQVLGKTIRATRVPHGEVETYGFEIRCPDGGSVFYAPDVEYGPVIKRGIQRAKVAILDATTADEPVAGHMSLSQVMSLANDFPEKRFFATHRGRYSVELRDLPANLSLPRAGDAFTADG